MLKVRENQDCLLISIEALNRDALFHCYRDYLVFMSLVRDSVNGLQMKIYGFCWLKNRSYMLIQPQNNELKSALLKLLKRYHYWLLQRNSSTTEFKLQILQLKEMSWTLDCLRFLHQQAVNENVVDDAMDYHWHSHHVYNGFWSMNWLDREYILKQFAANELVAMNRFRQYMLHGHRLNFIRMLKLDDSSKQFMIDVDENSAPPFINKQQTVAEVNSQYHQSLLERTNVGITYRKNGCLVKVRVFDRILKEVAVQ